jgi:non-ribosomal peptide synthetase component F
MHHAIYDGWTFDLMLRDLHELLRGNPTTPRPQYREVTQHYLEISNSNRLSKSVDYWGNVLRDYHPQPLPNFNGNAVPSTGLCSIHGEYEFDSVAFYSGAKEHLIHPQVFYQAAVALVISQYAGAPDIVIGSVMSGRTIPVTRVEEAMGPCIATLPYRVDMSCTTVEDLLQDTHRANRTMLEHCVLPLRNIAKLCHLRPGERLFDVLLVWQESLVSAANRHLSLRKIDGADDSEFKITVELEPCDKQILYRITYDPSTIPAHQAKMFAKQIQHTVQFFLNNRTGTLEQVKRSFNAEELSIVHSQPDIPKFQHGPAHAVEKWATKFPDKDALVFGSIIDGVMKVREKLSYDSLNARANQLAHALVAVGVGHDQLVCVILDKSVHLYVSILAILKTGCGYLPIVPDTPSERVNRILADAAVKVCVSDSRGLRNVQRDDLVILDPQDLNIAKYPEHNLKTPYDGSHLAYAVFTSGSTGKPKGVLVTQDNLMSNLHHLSSLYPYNEDSKLLQSCSQAFDVSVFEIFFSWYVGICLCTATQDDLFFDFEASINLLDVTHLSLTPTVASLVDPARTPKVELLVTAGEALTEIVKRRWAGKKLYQGKHFRILEDPMPRKMLNQVANGSCV